MSEIIVIKLPKLGLTMEEGELLEWLVEDGAAVEEGQPTYILATDKVENEIESPTAGMIRLIGEVETTYKVGDVLAEITSS
jgi:pyruvate/2-oxoglutarate dehydrogenase complex dihydrolipoamide acyltransferase (E2) component